MATETLPGLFAEKRFAGGCPKLSPDRISLADTPTLRPRPSQEWWRRAIALLAEVLPLSDEAFRQALDHSEQAFRLLDSWADYRCVDALTAGLPEGYAPGPAPRREEYLLATLVTTAIDGQQYTSLPHLKALLLVGIVEGRPEGELISDLASGALKAARRDGAWRRAIPPPLPADAGPAKVLEHCLDHARDLLAKPARWSPVERAWFAALQRWCQLLQSGGTVRRRSRGLLRTKTVLVEKVETPPEGSDEGPEPPPAWIIRLRHDDPQPVRPSEIGPELAEPPPTALPEVSLSGLGAPPPREDEPESPEAGEARRARTGFRTALENQFLPWANRQLIPDDRVSLVAALKSNLGSDAPAAQDVAGLLGFTHVTGQLIEQAALIDRTPAPDRSYLSDRVYMRYVAPQEGAWEPDDRQRLMLRPRATHVPLLLPSEVSDWLDRRLPVGVTLSEALGTTPVGARSRAREWLTALRESTGGLQSLSRVEWWLAQALYQPGPANGERADHVRPHLACGVTDGQPCPSAYYRAYEVNEVAALHREVLSDAGWTMPEAAAVQPGERRWVGSQLNLDLAQVKDLWARVTLKKQE